MGVIGIETRKPIAYDSPDHIQPHGTAQDNTTQPRFNRKLYRYIPARDVRLLDIGCSGGGLVKSIIDDGGFSVGVEGSDYSRKIKRAEWATIPDHLFTADATEPFQLFEEQGDGTRVPLLFNVITAWEFFEHIAVDGLEGTVSNILRHLAPRGFLLASIATFSDIVSGVTLHQTVHQKPWWIKTFSRLGMEHQGSLERYFHFDMVNGLPNGPSFTIALTRKVETPPDPARLRELIRADMLRGSLQTLHWLSLPPTWKYLAWQTKRKIESRLPGGRPFE
jgi:SAM-dependent methyltransferase